MIKEQLYIEGKLVDLSVGGKITRTLVANSLGDITAKQSSYSTTIKLPRTANNIQIFDGLGMVGNTSTSQYKRLRMSYSYESMPVAQGYAIINSVTDTFNISIYNGIIELQEQIKDKGLNDLDKSNLNHTLNVSNMINYISNSNLPFVYSPFQDHLKRESEEEEGSFLSLNTSEFRHRDRVAMQEQMPYIKAEWLFRAIFNDAGFEVTGDLFEGEIYQQFSKEVITISNGIPINRPISNLTGAKAYTGIEVNKNLGSLTSFSDTTRVSGFSPNYRNSSLSVYSSGSIVANRDGLLEIEINTFRFSQEDGSRPIIIGRNISQGTTEILYDGLPTRSADIVWRSQVNYDDLLFVEVQASSTYDQQNDRVGNRDHRLEYDLDMSFQFRFYDNLSFPINGSDLNLGDIKQSDFIKEILTKYGLLINRNTQTGVFETKNINNLLSDKSNALDWSSKFVSIDETSFSNSYGQKNYFKGKYVNDEDTYYDTFFNLDNELADSEKTIFESRFQLPEQRNRDIYNGTLSVDARVHPILEYDPTTYSSYSFLEKKPMLLKFGTSSPTNHKFYWRENYPDQLYTSATVSSNFFSVPEPYEKLFTTYMSEYIKLLGNYKVVKAKLNLSLADAYKLDFHRLIYLRQTSKYYYINKIKNNVTNPISEAELVEINI